MLFIQDIDKLLNEITIKDKWEKESNKWNGKFDAETFEYLCSLDPTTNPNKVGRYANWILAKYNPNADFDRLKVCLEWYADGIKRGIINRLGISNDINAYKSYDEFITAMNGVMHSDDSSMSNSEYNNRQKLEGQFEIVGSNSTFDIVACKTFEAERYFGSGTKWCTVANEEYFEDYMKHGQLYIVYPKNGNEELKMQFHFKSNSYADKDDNVYTDTGICIEATIEDEKIQTELIELCKRVFPQYKTKFIYFEESLPIALQRLANGEDPYDIFDWVGDFVEGFAVVELKDKWNFINTEGEILCNQWFDYVVNFSDGFAGVNLNDEWNFINTEGKIAFNQWFDYVYSFIKRFAFVELNDKVYQLNINGNLYDLDGNKINNNIRENKMRQRVRLTESSLRKMIKESIRQVLNEDWENNYNDAMEKYEYEQNKSSYDSKKWYQKLLAMITGKKPKDPNPEQTLQQLLDGYVEAYNNENGLGQRTDYPTGETFHSRMGWQNDNKQPVLRATYQDKMGNIQQSRKAFNNDGSKEEWGIAYPYSEMGTTGDTAPEDASDDVKRQYSRFNSNQQNISNAIKRRNIRKQQ